MMKGLFFTAVLAKKLILPTFRRQMFCSSSGRWSQVGGPKLVPILWLWGMGYLVVGKNWLRGGGTFSHLDENVVMCNWVTCNCALCMLLTFRFSIVFVQVWAQRSILCIKDWQWNSGKVSEELPKFVFFFFSPPPPPTHTHSSLSVSTYPVVHACIQDSNNLQDTGAILGRGLQPSHS